MGCHILLHLHLKTGMENISGCCLTVCPAPKPLPLASVSLHTDYSFSLSLDLLWPDSRQNTCGQQYHF